MEFEVSATDGVVESNSTEISINTLLIRKFNSQVIGHTVWGKTRCVLRRDCPGRICMRDMRKETQ